MCALGPSASPSADGPAPSDESGSGAGDARFERLGITYVAEPYDSGCDMCVASSSLIATSKVEAVLIEAKTQNFSWSPLNFDRNFEKFIFVNWHFISKRISRNMDLGQLMACVLGIQ